MPFVVDTPKWSGMYAMDDLVALEQCLFWLSSWQQGPWRSDDNDDGGRDDHGDDSAVLASTICTDQMTRR